MVDQGLLRVAAPRTRVANRKVHRRAELTSLWDDLRRAGRHPETTILTHEIVTDGARRPPSISTPTPPCCPRRAGVPPTATPSRTCTTGSRRSMLADIPLDELREMGLYAALRNRGVPGRGPADHRGTDADTDRAQAPRHPRAATRADR